MPTRQIYLGYPIGKIGQGGTVFRSAGAPTFANHGATYAACVGPFRTVRGARFMRDYGFMNPHCRCVAEVEALAKRVES